MRRRTEDFIPVGVVGRFVDTATLNSIGPGYRVQTAMAQMGTPVVESAVLPVLSTDNEYPLRQIFSFEPYGATGDFQLGSFTQIYGQFPIRKIPVVSNSGFCRG